MFYPPYWERRYDRRDRRYDRRPNYRYPAYFGDAFMNQISVVDQNLVNFGVQNAVSQIAYVNQMNGIGGVYQH